MGVFLVFESLPSPATVCLGMPVAAILSVRRQQCAALNATVIFSSHDLAVNTVRPVDIAMHLHVAKQQALTVPLSDCNVGLLTLFISRLTVFDLLH